MWGGGKEVVVVPDVWDEGVGDPGHVEELLVDKHQAIVAQCGSLLSSLTVSILESFMFVFTYFMVLSLKGILKVSTFTRFIRTELDYCNSCDIFKIRTFEWNISSFSMLCFFPSY